LDIPLSFKELSIQLNIMEDLKNVLSKPTESSKDNSNPPETNLKKSGSINEQLQKMFTIVDKEKETIYFTKWNRLDKTYKLHKLYEYCDQLREIYDLSEETYETLKKQMKKELDLNKLNKRTMVDYDEEKGIINEIKHLEYSSETDTFTFMRKETKPKVSTKTKGNIDRLLSNKKKK
jgi:hypothetical protein